MTKHQGSTMNQSHSLSRPKRTLLATLAALQIIPAGLLPSLAPSLAHAQQTNATTYGYDAQGNLTTITDPNSKTTTQTPDALNRITTQNLPPAAAGASAPIVKYTYDGQNRLLSVTDGKGVKTTYSRGGLNDSIQGGKDVGSLSSIRNENGDEYYSTNNRSLSRWVSSYDQLNRPTNINYVDENTTTIIGHTKLGYDAYVTTAGAENYGVGRLTSVIDYIGSGTANISNSVSWRYDQLGRLTWRCQWLSAVSAGSATACSDSDALKYRWAPNSGANAGRLMGLTYPSGRLVDYQYDTQGRISAITTTDPSSSTARGVISSVSYVALDMAASGYAPTGWTFGDGSGTPVQTYTRSFDSWARVSGFTLGTGASGLKNGQNSYALTLDDAGRLTEIDSISAQSQLISNIYGYDDLNRLKSVTLPGGAQYSYDYDLNGNRIQSVSGGVNTKYTYPPDTVPGNRLSTVQVGAAAAQGLSYDGTGNITQDPAAVVGAAVTYTYDDRANVPFGRLSRSQGPGAQWDYQHNFFGQRIRKTGSSYTPAGGSAISPTAYVGSTDTQFYYDVDGHLIAEVDASVGSGTATKPVKREYIWLGDTLVATIAGSTPTATISASNTAALYYVHTDHLDTPRMVTDTTGSRRWTWDIMSAEPFGASAANEAPTGQASAQAFTLNIRFPGQYLDKETGSFYNYFRTYNPSTGRYLQSDPVGLEGGLNSFGYAVNDPLRHSDPTGRFLPAIIIGGEIALDWGLTAMIGNALWNLTHPNSTPIPTPGDPNQCKNENNCQPRYNQISLLVSELKKRYSDLIQDKKGLPATGPMSIEGHRQQFKNKQASLRNMLNAADVANCTGYQSDAWTWATIEAPYPHWGGGMP